MAFSTASSGMRSRTDCIMVLPVRNNSVKSTAPTIAFTMTLMLPICLSCACAYSASSWVSVSSDEFANRASMAAHIAADRSGSSMLTMNANTRPLSNCRASSKYA